MHDDKIWTPGIHCPADKALEPESRVLLSLEWDRWPRTPYTEEISLTAVVNGL